jgi:nitroreductase
MGRLQSGTNSPLLSPVEEVAMDTLDALNSRRGSFKFKSDPVAPEKLDLVVQAAANAPSPVNLQPWAFITVTEHTLARQVAKYLIDIQARCVFGLLLGMPAAVTDREMEAYTQLANAPCFVVLCLEPKVDFALPEHREALHAWYLVSLGAALANLMTAATALGLGTRLFGSFGLEDRGQGLKDLLGVPPEIEVVAATPLGYPEDTQRLPPLQSAPDLAAFRRGDPATLPGLFRGRLPLPSLVHKNGW